MKLYRNAIILLVVFLVLLGGYFTYNSVRKNSSDEGTSSSNRITLFETKRNNITELTIECGEKYVFTRQGEEVVQTAPEGVDFGSYRINGIIANLAEIYANKIVEENPTDLKQYGLDSPLSTVTIKLADGTTKVFYLGNELPSRSGYFLMDKDANTVYAVNYLIADDMLLEPEDTRSKDVFPYVQDDVIGISLAKNGKLTFSAEWSQENGWMLTEPLRVYANSARISPMIESAVRFRIVDFIDEGIDLEKFGLITPAYTIELRTNDSSETLFLGKELVRGRTIYGQLKSTGQVFTMDMTYFNFGDCTTRDVMDSFVYLKAIGKVTKVVVNSGSGSETVLDIDTGSDSTNEDDVFWVNGELMSDEEDVRRFRLFYQNCIGFLIDKLDLDAKPSGTPEVTMTFTTKDEGVVKIEFIPKDSESYYVIRNGEYVGFTATKESIDELKKREKDFLTYLK